VAGSPIEALLGSFDALDLEAVMAQVAPGGGLSTADGRRAEGKDAVREVVADLFAQLRSASYRIVTQWHVDDVWIAELEVDYELQDFMLLKGRRRAFILHQGPDGIADLHVYGEHERPVGEHRTGEEGMWIGDRWIPPL
jgi:SnoaL-like domain